jgi:hypothetical protein
VAPGLGVWGNIPGTEVLMSLIGIPVPDLTSNAGILLDLQERGPAGGRSHPYCPSGGTLELSKTPMQYTRLKTVILHSLCT